MNSCTYHVSLGMRKSTICVSEQARHKSACAVTDAGDWLKILDLSRRVLSEYRQQRRGSVTAQLICSFGIADDIVGFLTLRLMKCSNKHSTPECTRNTEAMVIGKRILPVFFFVFFFSCFVFREQISLRSTNIQILIDWMLK